jgi:hypothetical protein
MLKSPEEIREQSVCVVSAKSHRDVVQHLPLFSEKVWCRKKEPSS